MVLKHLAKFILFITEVHPITNVFSGATVTFSPNPWPVPGTAPAGAHHSVCDAQLPTLSSNSWWGYCTDYSSTLASIRMSSATPITARTIFTTYQVDGIASGGPKLQTPSPDSTISQTMNNQNTNGLHYNGNRFQVSALQLSVAPFLINQSSVRLCTPEILVIDDHPLWKVSGTRTQSFTKSIRDSTATNTRTWSTMSEVDSRHWTADSSCFSYILMLNERSFQLYLHLSDTQPGPTEQYKLNELVLLTGIYLVLGPDNNNNNVKLVSHAVIIDFAGQFAQPDSSTSITITANDSGIFPVNPTTGFITYMAKIYSTSAAWTQICRYMPLGYPCCFISSITDTTPTVNSYFIHPLIPKTPIQKIFQVGFFIDSAKQINNVLFCSIGIQATLICTTCPTFQPDFVIVITQDGMITISISTTSFTNIGLQTMQLTVIDTRNLEQTAGMQQTFGVTFTTCSVSVTTPNNFNYILRNSQQSQVITATESDTCLFPVTCSIDSAAPLWVTNVGCTVSWSTSDTTQAYTTYTVPITITYGKLPTSQTLATSFTVTLSCVTTNTFTASPATYTIKNPAGTQTLIATNTCGYSMTYTRDALLTPLVPWVSLLGSTVSWQTSDLTITPADYTTTVVATFLSTPSTTLQANLVITLLACREIYNLIPPTDQSYNIGSTAASQVIYASDSSSCGYVPVCTLSFSTPLWISVSNCIVSWQTNDNSLLAAPSQLVLISISLHNIAHSTQFYISIQPCVLAYQFQAPINVNYELFTAAATQILVYTLTSPTSCGYTPVCSLLVSPSWASISNCVVQWQSSNTRLQVPSTHSVQIQLTYVDFFSAQNLITTTDFQIKVTPAITLCTTAILQANSTSSIALLYNKKVIYDLTPSDSVSTMFAQPNYCGLYSVTWPVSPASWLTLTTSGFNVDLLQNQYSSSGIQIQIVLGLANYPLINTTQTIQIQAKDCSISSFLPQSTSKSMDYLVGSGTSKVEMPVFTVTTDCETSFIYTVTIEQKSGKTCDASNFSVSTSQFQIQLSETSFAGEVLIFGVTATLSDKSLTTNSALFITVNVGKQDATSVGNPSQVTTQTSNTSLKNTKQTSAKSTSPSFILLLPIAESIRCLKSDQAESWAYETPQIQADDSKIVDFKFSCPGVQSIFKVDLQQNYSKLTLDTSSAQPYPGYYPATMTLSYKNENIETKYSLSFVIDCDERFATALLQTRPKPRIQQITGTGAVTIFWNTTLIQISNFTRLNTSTVLIDNILLPSLQVSIQPGKMQEDASQLVFNFSVSAMDSRSLTLQLKFKNPEAISTISLSLEKLVVTFNDPSYFIGTSNKMSVLQGSSIFSEIPRQQLNGQVQLKLPSATGASKAAMLASLSMPYILSTVLSQLLSVIRSFTLIVHMQAISLMFPANVVAFFSVLAPLVMFDLIPTQDISNKIFKFPDLNDDGPLTLQFGQLGYSSLLMVQNMGSLFFMICAYPVLIIFSVVVRKVLARPLSKNKVGRKVFGIIDQVVKSAFWNFPISFLFESYLLICISSLIGLKSLVFSDYQIWAQAFCSVVAVIGVSIVLLFPVTLYILYRKKLRSNDPLPDPTQMSAAERQEKFWIDDIESILEHYFTQKQMVEFMTKYGCLIEEVDLKKVGVNVAILTPLFDMIRKAIVAVALVYFTKKPFFVIFTFNLTTLFYISFQLHYAPLVNYIEYVRTILNEITVLAVVYHMFCLTDFVQSIQTQSLIGNFLIQTIILNGVLNVLLSLTPPTKKAILLLKRCRARSMQKKASSVKVTQLTQLKQSLEQQTLTTQQVRIINTSLRRAPIVDSVLSEFTLADIKQPFTKFQMPTIGNISPLQNPVSINQSNLDETHDESSVEQQLIDSFRTKPRDRRSIFRAKMMPELESIPEMNEVERVHNLLLRAPEDA